MENRSMRIVGAFLVLLCAACGGAGFGDDVRKDIQKQMATVHDVATACYASALQHNRKLKGTLVVQVKTDPETGAFQHASVKSTELRDKELEQCVLEAVTHLKLDKPTTTSVEADYPIEFASRK